MAKNKKGWRVVVVNGREYAKYGNKTYRCCRASMVNGSMTTWIYVRSINRYICM